MLFKLPFYEELNVIKTIHAFRGYTISYKIVLVEKKDPIKQWEASKSSIKDFFSDLLNETKGFKCQITLKVMLKKKQEYWNWICSSLFQFNNIKSDKSQIQSRKCFSRNFVQDR